MTGRRIPNFHARLRDVLSSFLPGEWRVYVDGPGGAPDPIVILYLDPYGRSGIVQAAARERSWLDPKVALGRILAATDKDAVDPRYTDKARADSVTIAAALRTVERGR